MAISSVLTVELRTDYRLMTQETRGRLSGRLPVVVVGLAGATS